LGNAVLQNVYVGGLPPLDDTTLASLRSSFDLPAVLSPGQRDAVIDSCKFTLRDPPLTPDMSGLNKVFIFFVPIVGVCLLMSLFIKVCREYWSVLTDQDRPLEAPRTEPVVSQETEVNDEKSCDEEQGLDTLR
jgi:hypothetical protein